MTKQTPIVGVLSPGDMGRSIGMVLQAHGVRTLTCLSGRSERTRALAADAGFEDTASLAELVQRVDILLCVLVPDRAAGVADEVAAAVRATGADLLYADCNAVSPQSVRAIAATLEDAGARFVDVGIVGPPPVVTGFTRSSTHFHASGSGSVELAALGSHGLDVRLVGPEVGQASGLKMCYGALTKGLQALGTELLVAAEMLGLANTLRVEQEESVPELLGWLRRMVPSMPPKAYRWVGEMEEIARTFDELGLTPGILQGAADLYAFVTETPLARESPESRDRTRDLDAVVAVLARNAAQRARAARPAVPTRVT